MRLILLSKEVAGSSGTLRLQEKIEGPEERFDRYDLRNENGQTYRAFFSSPSLAASSHGLAARLKKTSRLDAVNSLVQGGCGFFWDLAVAGKNRGPRGKIR